MGRLKKLKKMEEATLLKTSAVLVRHAIAIAVLLTRLECSDGDADEDDEPATVTDACIARAMALAFITHKTDDDEVAPDITAPLNVRDGKAYEEEEAAIDTDDEDVSLDASDLLSQIAELEETFRTYEPHDGIERHVVEYIRQRLIDTNTGSC